ncbi:MAG: hypothetical protein JSU94_20915 [Phycisphaerales bacterium]|nr:MAG: hypothetical protein JSU94_20915 [Phycisphaerales bacterium]
MKKYVLSFLAAALLVPAAAFSMEHEGPENPERQMELRTIEMEMQRREAEMNFEEQMRNLEMEQRKLELERAERALADSSPEGGRPLLALFLIGCFVVNVLAAIWVGMDIRARACGSGIWVVIALLAGLCGTLVYAVVRLGDITDAKGNARKRA